MSNCYEKAMAERWLDEQSPDNRRHADILIAHAGIHPPCTASHCEDGDCDHDFCYKAADFDDPQYFWAVYNQTSLIALCTDRDHAAAIEAAYDGTLQILREERVVSRKGRVL